MIIGAKRAEEAAIHDEYTGFHFFHTEEDREPYGSFKVFFHDGGYIEVPDDPGVEIEPEAGWYWRAGFPGCLPESIPWGPFSSSFDALKDADEWNPEIDWFFED